jgi:uncharacterized protein (TIGR03435 family)
MSMGFSIKYALGIVALVLTATIGAGEYQHLDFDVASIKPNNSGASGSNTQFPSVGRFSATNVWLKLLIRIAYGVPAYQVTGGEDWTSSLSRFDIEAKTEEIPPTNKCSPCFKRC